MIDKADHVAWAAAAVAVFQRHCGTGDEHAIADLVCDLAHLGEARGFDFLSEVRRGIGHWYAEHHVSDRNHHHYSKVVASVAQETRRFYDIQFEALSDVQNIGDGDCSITL